MKKIFNGLKTMNYMRYVILFPVVCFAKYSYYIGINTEATTLIKTNSTRDAGDNIQYPNTSNYYDEYNLSLGVNKKIDFNKYHIMLTGTLFPLSQTHTLFDVGDAKSIEGDNDGDAYSTHYGQATQKTHAAFYIGAGIRDWDIGVQCELKRYDFAFGYYGTENITEPWDQNLFIGPMFRAQASVSENLSVGLQINRLWGPDTLAQDLQNHTISNGEDYSNDNVDNPTTYTTTWSQQLEKTSFTATNAGFFVIYSPNGEKYE